jgi:hypothetical protein
VDDEARTSGVLCDEEVVALRHLVEAGLPVNGPDFLLLLHDVIDLW